MIRYKFKVEVPFLDKTNNLKEVKKDAILEVTEERLQQLNAAEVGRVISAEYVENKTPAKPTRGKNKKEEVVEKEDTTNEGETTETEEVVEPKADATVETEPKVEE